MSTIPRRDPMVKVQGRVLYLSKDLDLLERQLHGEIVKVLKLPDVTQRLDGLGFEIVGSTPDEFGAYIRSEIKKWEKVVRASGAKPD